MDILMSDLRVQYGAVSICDRFEDDVRRVLHFRTQGVTEERRTVLREWASVMQTRITTLRESIMLARPVMISCEAQIPANIRESFKEISRSLGSEALSL